MAESTSVTPNGVPPFGDDMTSEVCNQPIVCDVCKSSEHLVAFQTKRVETVHYVNTRTFYWCATCTAKFVVKVSDPKF